MPIKILGLVLVAAWPFGLIFGQSQHSQQPQSSQQSQEQSQTQAPSQPQQKQDTTGDAGKRAQKDKPKPKKVYTEDDLSGMRGNGVSVVGDDKPAGAKTATGKAGTNATPGSGQDEQYWRRHARQILSQIEATDQKIAKVKEEIKKYGTAGFDAQSGMKDGIVYIQDRNGHLQELEKHRADLEKKLDQLQEEGRKAGAEPAWFR